MWLTQRGEEKGKLWGKRYFPPFCPLISQEEKHIRLTILISIAFKKLDLCNEYLPGGMPAGRWQPACLGAEGVRFPLSLSLSTCYVWCEYSLRWEEGHLLGFCEFMWHCVGCWGVVYPLEKCSVTTTLLFPSVPPVSGSEAVALPDARMKLPLRAKLWPCSLCRWPKQLLTEATPAAQPYPHMVGPCPTTSWGTQAGHSSKGTRSSITSGYRIWQEQRERPECGRKNRWVFSRQNRGKSNK